MAASQQHKVDNQPLVFIHHNTVGNVGTQFFVTHDNLPDINKLGLGRRCWNRGNLISGS